MRPTTILASLAGLAIGASAAPAAASTNNELHTLHARSCNNGHFEHGEYWQYHKPNGLGFLGCAWYYCSGSQSLMWIDCGTKWCHMINGAPSCG